MTTTGERVHCGEVLLPGVCYPLCAASPVGSVFSCVPHAPPATPSEAEPPQPAASGGLEERARAEGMRVFRAIYEWDEPEIDYSDNSLAKAEREMERIAANALRNFARDEIARVLDELRGEVGVDVLLGSPPEDFRRGYDAGRREAIDVIDRIKHRETKL